MSAQKIIVSVEIGTDEQYCYRCRWMECCPPGCRLFNVPLKLCLGGGSLRCEACIAAEKETKEKK